MKFLLSIVLTLGSLSAFAENTEYHSPATGNYYKNVSVITSGPNAFGVVSEIGSAEETRKCNDAKREMVLNITDQHGLVLEASCDYFDGLFGHRMIIVFTR